MSGSLGPAVPPVVPPVGTTGPSGSATALVVVDLQNDFCAGPVAAARFPGDPARLTGTAARCAQAVATARAHGIEVLFVRFLGDLTHQGAAWRRRDAELGKSPKCLEGTWGADYHAVRPLPGEAEFTKRACFDAFLDPEFEPHLRRRGIEHLVLVGLFTDVCVDSTARTAFQRGFHLTVLRDCTTALHLADTDILRFMARVYGARITTLADLEPADPADPALAPTAWAAPTARTAEAPTTAGGDR
ncbi:cysteine hydrolase family protein [Kitasatospora sp. NPDC089509]|uniref:cysteine hydrolase family protein n=1 Tax=Kitasatospora sp. NPDC089509 TaxID=3364079 RepID=UPI00381F7B90